MLEKRLEQVLQNNGSRAKTDTDSGSAAPETAPAPQHQCPMYVGGEMGVNSANIGDISKILQ